ncbi:sulfurtransferase complex subunit TusB [Marinobacterium mangrovicola]|uniref:tRNA 2-thiouridine synthesizing protein B n=1 Tax=Marinobacterium mangrovicola TaxID=1476959 RepID=A0A4R1GKX6_9GAMM|nr:sulfurtransferase complex subunit TusB [Marinobacterium mangrovicola]TCK09054.1 tRNA 2-thiouridine synthesizing protein B [Marinobacterium mangrovicola]
MILHTLNQAPSNKACLESCLEAMAPEDSLLLIEDGVYWLQPPFRDLLPAEGKLFALTPDIQARGLEIALEQQVDDAGFVELSVSHDKVVSWF